MEQKRHTPQQLKATLKKYLQENATEAEKQAIETWYESFNDTNAEPFKNDIQKHRIHQALIGKVDSVLLTDGPKRGITRQLWYRITAAVVILLLSVIGIYHYLPLSSSAEKDQLVQTEGNQKKEVTLPDGSVIELNGHSRLVISKDFNRHNRTVSLQGEAFFDVAKNPAKPFIIHSGALQTTVKGTSFDIRAYPDLGHIKVAVATGIVKVASIAKNRPTLVLTEGIKQNETLTYNIKTGKSEVKSESAAAISSWRNNELYIDNYNLAEIASLLERQFAITVKMEAGINRNEHFTMKMKNPSLQHTVQVLSALTKHKFILSNNQIILQK